MTELTNRRVKKMDIVYTFKKTESINISFSYDTVYRQNPEYWEKAIALFKDAGHNVIFATIRSSEFNEGIEETAIKLGCELHYSEGVPLKKYFKSKNISIGIWIHGNPKSILKTQKDDNQNFLDKLINQDMLIALDFDDTYTEDVETFDDIVRLSKDTEDVDIRIVTLRNSTLSKSKDIQYICDNLGGGTTRPRANKLTVVFTKLQAKEQYLNLRADYLPYNHLPFLPTVWIDDNPRYIINNHPRWEGYKLNAKQREYFREAVRKSYYKKKRDKKKHEEKWKGENL